MSYIITQEMYEKYFNGFLDHQASHIINIADKLSQKSTENTYEAALLGALTNSVTTLTNFLIIDENSNSVRKIVCQH